MASVGREVLRLYDEGRYGITTAKQLLLATINGVNWCDGNPPEAAVSLAGRCAHCLKKVEIPEKELIFGEQYFLRESGFYGAYDFDSKEAMFVDELYMEDQLLAPQVCHECFKLLKQD